MPASTSEADIVINRANVYLAKLQRLISSSLPPQRPEELANAKSEEQIEKEEEAIFTPEQDGVGLGFHVPDSDTTRHSITNDTLRKKLLGKTAQKRGSGAHIARNGVNKFQSQHTMQSKPQRATRAPTTGDDDEDEEEGRGSLGKSKRRRVEDTSNEDTPMPEDARARKTVKTSSSSYLDEVLSERAKGKKKKKKKKPSTAQN